MKKSSNNYFASVKKGILKTFTFHGRSNQFEFATYFFTTLILYYGGSYLFFSAFSAIESMHGSFFFVWWLLVVFIAISQISNGARRLEDMNVNKWALLIGFIPIIGIFFIIYLCATPSVTKKRKK